MEHGVKRQKSEVGSRRSEDRKKSEVRGRKSEITRLKTEDGGQKEIRSQRSEVGDQKTEDGEQRERVQAGKGRITLKRVLEAV